MRGPAISQRSVVLNPIADRDWLHGGDDEHAATAINGKVEYFSSRTACLFRAHPRYPLLKDDPRLQFGGRIEVAT
jgi:hypothetical protein